MRTIILLCIIAVLSSCSNNKTVRIDNPTGETLNIKIDEKHIRSIKPYGQDRVVLQTDSSVVYVDDVEIGTIVFDDNGDYLLNPTLSRYYIEEVTYGIENKNPSIPFGIFFFDSIPYIGNAMKDSSLLIKDIWDFGIDEDLPEEIASKSGAAVRKKVYREHAFERHTKKIYREAMSSK